LCLGAEIFELKVQRPKIRRPIFPIVFLYILFWHNQVSWKEEFCRGSSSTLHLNILCIFLIFCLGAEIFKLKVQRAIVWSPISPIVFLYIYFWYNQVSWKRRVLQRNITYTTSQHPGHFFRRPNLLSFMFLWEPSVMKSRFLLSNIRDIAA